MSERGGTGDENKTKNISQLVTCIIINEINADGLLEFQPSDYRSGLGV